MPNKQQNIARDAAVHHTTLNTFASIVQILEGGTVYDPAAYKAAQRIIKIAQQEEQRQLRKYDKAMAKL